MLFVLVGLWTIGMLLIVTDPKRKTTRWISSIAFTGGAGGLSAVLNEQIQPWLLAQRWIGEPGAAVIDRIEYFSSITCYYGLPYTFLMFTLVYYPGYAVWPPRLTRWLKWLLLAPPALSFLFDPLPGRPIPYHVVVWWAAPYILTGVGFLLTALLKERNSFLRRSRLLTLMAAAPTLLFAMGTLYVLPAFFGLYESWRYNAWVIAFTLAVIVGSSFRYGFMGLQISIQNQRLDYTLRAITSGTAILNHAIKNDVGKIRLFGEKLKSDVRDNEADPAELEADIEVIMAASRHIYDMIYRIQGQTQEQALHPEPFELADLLAECVRASALSLGDLKVEEQYMCAGSWVGDRAQLLEVCTNLVTNAVEAMPHGGTLVIRLTETKRNYVVEVKDTGIGMDKKQLKLAFDPFYTTKAGKKMNFGLGLSYCYNIIHRHKGTMNLHSKPGHGTSVFIHLPKKKWLPVGRELV